MIFFHKYWFKFVCKEGRRSKMFASFFYVLQQNPKKLPKIANEILMNVKKYC